VNSPEFKIEVRVPSFPKYIRFKHRSRSGVEIPMLRGFNILTSNVFDAPEIFGYFCARYSKNSSVGQQSMGHSLKRALRLCLLVPFVVHSGGCAAGDDLAMKAGLGVAVQSDGNDSPLVEMKVDVKDWVFNANVSGYSESKTKVTHALAGILYSLPLVSGGALEAEFGLGALMAQTSAEGNSERMFNYTVPVGLNWTMLQGSGLVLEANWKSWLFASHPYIPIFALLSHDRFTTLAVSAGVSL